MYQEIPTLELESALETCVVSLRKVCESFLHCLMSKKVRNAENMQRFVEKACHIPIKASIPTPNDQNIVKRWNMLYELGESR